MGQLGWCRDLGTGKVGAMVGELRDRDEIERYCLRDPLVHAYELGDLDPFFWPHTRWYGLRDDSDVLQAVGLLYAGGDTPSLLAHGRDRQAALVCLLRHLRRHLPDRFYAHLSPDLATALAPDWRPTWRHDMCKMGLADRHAFEAVYTSDVERLALTGVDEVLEFFRDAYPDNFFDPRMLETGHYYAARCDGRLAAVAGVHVYSATYRVAALGNIATHPDHRGRGLGRRVTARLCKALVETVDTIGLNVAADNEPALALYRRLGFELVSNYDELLLER